MPQHDARVVGINYTQARSYFVVITNVSGATNSALATLTVNRRHSPILPVRARLWTP